MSPLDALFLHLEDGISHMHIGSCAVFEGPPPSFAELSDLINSKLVRVPRYRQKVRFVPGGLGHPAWVDDPNFDLASHMVHAAVPPPGDESELENLMGRVMSQELDRRRPLWEMWMIEGLADSRWALICKVHHCMVDGIAGTDLIAVLLDAEQDAVTCPAEPWHPAPGPSDVHLAADALVAMGLRPIRRALSWPRSGPGAGGVWKGVTDTVQGLRSFTRLLTPVEPLSIEGRIGTRRRWAASRCALDDVRVIRKAFGGSSNDVILSAISAAFRTVLMRRGDPLDEAVVLRSLVPVSIRHSGDHTLNNQVSLLIADLPVGVGDPVARLEGVRTQMSALKASHQVDVGAAALAGAEFLPPILLPLGARAMMSLLRRHPQRAINTVTTNVPGPQFPLYALGRQMVEYLPFVPLSHGVRIGVAIVSYNGWFSFGITGDYETAADVRVMAAGIVAEIAALRTLATKAP